MHEFGRMPDGRTEELTQGLVAQAHAQHRDLALGAVGDGLQGGTGALGIAGAGGDEDAVVSGLEPRGIHDIVTHNVHDRAQVAQVAHDREDERVIVVDAEDSCHRRSFHVRGRGPFSVIHRRALPQWARGRCPTNERCGAESGGIESGDAFTNERWETDPAPAGQPSRNSHMQGSRPRPTHADTARGRGGPGLVPSTIDRLRLSRRRTVPVPGMTGPRGRPR